MPQNFLLRRSITPGAVPPASEFNTNTLVINLADGKLYWRDSGSTVRSVKFTATDVDAALALLAPKASPAFTGTPTAPTPVTATNTTQLATTAFVQAVVAALADTSPAALNTINELAAALGNDPNFATTITTALANRVRFDAAQTLTAGQKTQAQTNMGAGTAGASVFAASTLAAIKSFLAYTAADVGALSVVAASLATNGYIRFSNGLMLQWGINTGSGGQRTTFYPVSFPSACFVVLATICNGVSVNTTMETVHINGFDQFGFIAHPRFSAGTTGVDAAGEPFTWFGIGF